MAPKKSYTDFTTYARKNFSSAFDLVADPLAYTINCGHFRTMDGEVKEGELLEVAQSTGRYVKVPLWVWFNDGKLQYLEGELGGTMDFRLRNHLFYSHISKYVAPFCFVINRTRLKSTTSVCEVGRQRKERLDLLVKFVFLLTGRISEITNGDGVDMLVEFEELCMHIQQTEEMEEQERI